MLVFAFFLMLIKCLIIEELFISGNIQDNCLNHQESPVVDEPSDDDFYGFDPFAEIGPFLNDASFGSFGVGKMISLPRGPKIVFHGFGNIIDTSSAAQTISNLEQKLLEIKQGFLQGLVEQQTAENKDQETIPNASESALPTLDTQPINNSDVQKDLADETNEESAKDDKNVDEAGDSEQTEESKAEEEHDGNIKSDDATDEPHENTTVKNIIDQSLNPQIE